MREGWQIRKLGDVCSLLNRGVSPAYLEKGGVCVLNQKCIRNHEVSYEPARRHDDATKKVAEERFIQRGDVLVNSTGTGTLGRVAQVRNEPEEATTVDSHVTIVRAKPGLFHLEFFGYMLVVIEEAIKEAGDGCGGQTELARSVLAERFSVSYPESLPEQQRIVALLDETFAGLATAKINTEKNLRNARALFDSHLQSVFSQRGDGWEECPLEELTEPDSPITYGVVKPGPEGEIRFVRGGDLVSGKVRLTQLRTITREVSDQYRRTLLRGGELLICLVGQPGQVGVAPTELAGSNIERQVGLIRLSKKINSEFVRFFLQSAPGAEALGARESGSVQQVINLGELRQVAIPYPDFSEQVDIVARLNLVDAETQRLTRLYVRKLAALEELKKSLLHQAFNGEL